jgi:hypothetical protein
VREVTAEWLLRWVYQRQRADMITGRHLTPAEAAAERWGQPERFESLDGTAWVARHAAIGCKIDGGRIPGIADPLHPDAEVVHDLVLGLGWARAGLLVHYGKTGEAPQLPGAARLRPVEEWSRGRWRLKITRAYDRDLRCSRRWCHVVQVPDHRAVEAARDRYSAWHAACMALRTALAAVELRDYAVSGIETPDIDGVEENFLLAAE